MVAKRSNIDIHPDTITNPNTRINPSSNMYARNPTRIDLSQEVDDQRDIVDAIKAARAKRMKTIYEYRKDENGKWEYNGIPGVIKILEMRDEELVEFFRTMMRYKPNITGVNLTLGNYENLTPYHGPKIAKLNFRKPKYPTEVAEDWAFLFGDRALRIVKVEWEIKSAGPGAFECIGRAWAANEEEYNDLDKFSPTLDLEFVTM